MALSIKVAAVLPCKDEAPSAVRQTIDSLLEQSVAPNRIILIDDASSFYSYKNFEEGRIKVIRNSENVGISESRNIGAKRVSEEFILFINTGITIPQAWLEIVLKHAERHPNAAICTTHVVSHTPNQLVTKWRFRFIENAFTRKRQTARIPWCIGHVLLFRKQCFDSIGGFSAELRLSKEDGDISARLLRRGYEIWQVDGPAAICHQVNTVDLMAKKWIRNRGWSLSVEPYAGTDLRPLQLRPALKDQTYSLWSRLARNIGKGRLMLVCVDVALWLRARSLIRAAFRSSLQD